MGGHIYLVPAVDEMKKADIITLSEVLWEANQCISLEIHIIAAVTENLNCLAIIIPSVNDGLSKQAKLYSVNANLVNVEMQEMTVKDEDSISLDSNIEVQIT